jgi:hypothetical protein
MKKSLQGLVSVVLLGIILLDSCKKDPLSMLSNNDTRIYITNYDTTANFSSYQTFSVNDSVAVIQNNQLYGRELTAYDTAVKNAVIQQLVQRGYRQVSKSGAPDLAVDISRVYNTSTGLFSYPDYWYDYGDYWDPYYWGYPGYGYYAPYDVGTYTIVNGGLEIDVLDLRNAAVNGNKIKSVWTGLIRGEEVFTPSAVAAETAGLFDQSRYFKH